MCRLLNLSVKNLSEPLSVGSVGECVKYSYKDLGHRSCVVVLIGCSVTAGVNN